MERLRQSERSRARVQSLRRKLRLSEQALAVTRAGGWECDLATEALAWTDGLYRIYDLDPEAPLTRRAVLALYTDVSRLQLETTRSEAISRRQGFSVDLEVRTARANMRWVRITADVSVEAGSPVRLFGAQQDVTAERLEWERLRRLAECDPLTGLANRGIFDVRYRSLQAETADPPGHVLVLADLDRFKSINDRFGHAAGDECLREVASRFRRTFPEALLIARLGGDEFALLLAKPQGVFDLALWMSQAMARLQGLVFWNGHAIDVGVSLGAAMLVPGHGPHADKPFEHADEALYRAKAARRQPVAGRHDLIVPGVYV